MLGVDRIWPAHGGCEDYCERSVDEGEWQGDRVYLHLGAWHPFEEVVHRGH
jgi:hypothetical protein